MSHRMPFNPVIHRSQWLSKLEWRQLKIEGPVRSGGNIMIFAALGIRRRQEVGDFAPQKITDDPKDIVIGQVKQAIAAKPQFRLRQRVVNNIQRDEPRAGVAVERLVTLHQRFNNISAGIPDWRFPLNQSEPVVVTAGCVENRGNPKFLHQGREPLANVFRVRYGRARPGNTLIIPPSVVLIVMTKYFRGAADAGKSPAFKVIRARSD